MKKLVLIFLTVLLFSSANLPYVLADTSSLTHEQMVEKYGQGYADTYFKVFLEGNAKMAINEAENREALDGWIDGSKEYLSKRYEVYANLSAENGNTPLDVFKEFVIDGVTLAETGFDFLKSIFSSDDDLLPSSIPTNGSCVQESAPATSTSWRFYLNCDFYIMIPNIGNYWKGMQWVNKEVRVENVNEGVWQFPSNRNILSVSQPRTLRQVDTLVKKLWGSNSGIIDRNGVFVFGVPAVNYDTNIRTINNYIRDYTPKPLRIPILEPNAVCKDGQRVIFPDGSGGYLDGNGKPVDVSDCTITWKEPVIERAPDGQLMIDDKVLEVEEQVPPKEVGEGCDGVLCFLGSIAKAIGGVVSSLLEGLVAVFIPNDTSFIDKSFEKIQTTFTQKFAVIDSLKSIFSESFKETDTSALKDYSISIPFLGDKPIKIINFDYVDPYIGLFKNGLSAIMVVYTAWYCYRKVTGGGGVMEK